MSHSITPQAGSRQQPSQPRPLPSWQYRQDPVSFPPHTDPSASWRKPAWSAWPLSRRTTRCSAPATWTVWAASGSFSAATVGKAGWPGIGGIFTTAGAAVMSWDAAFTATGGCRRTGSWLAVAAIYSCRDGFTAINAAFRVACSFRPGLAAFSTMPSLASTTSTFSPFSSRSAQCAFSCTAWISTTLVITAWIVDNASIVTRIIVYPHSPQGFIRTCFSSQNPAFKAFIAFIFTSFTADSQGCKVCLTFRTAFILYL